MLRTDRHKGKNGPWDRYAGHCPIEIAIGEIGAVRKQAESFCQTSRGGPGAAVGLKRKKGSGRETNLKKKNGFRGSASVRAQRVALASLRYGFYFLIHSYA